MNELAVVAHSSLIGGSTAARLINCPGSYELLQRVPDGVETSSIWAEEGTAQHSAIAEIIETQCDPATMLGRVFNNVELTAEHVANLQAANSFANEKLEPGDEYILEQHVAFPGIEGGFGTVDLAIRKEHLPRMIVIDWKFGSGVYVPASTDGTANAQLLFYTCGLRHTFPRFFAGIEEIELYIFQPAFHSESSHD